MTNAKLLFKMQINSFPTETPNATSDLITGQPVTTQFASTSLPTQASKPTLIRSPYPGIGDPGSCPRPADQYGHRYQIMTGAFQSRGETQDREGRARIKPHPVPDETTVEIVVHGNDPIFFKVETGKLE